MVEGCGLSSGLEMSVADADWLIIHSQMDAWMDGIVFFDTRTTGQSISLSSPIKTTIGTSSRSTHATPVLMSAESTECITC